MVGATGFEPTTPWSQARCSTKLSYAPILTSSRAIILHYFIVVLMRNTSKLYMKLLLSKNGATGGIRTPDPRLRRPLLYPTELQTRKNGRSDRIRTYDPLVPSQVLYQTELRPDFNFVSRHHTSLFHRRTDAKHKQAIYEIVVVKKWCDWRDSNPRPTA